MNQIRKRLTYANVMSSIAVFMVLGGGAAIAAKTVLPKKSVGTKQLKANAVTTSKIKKNAVTAKKIKKNAVTTAKIAKDAVNGATVNEATLGTVPSATHAATADLANSIPPAEPTHFVGTGGNPGFEDGSKNIVIEGATFGVNAVGFYKDHEGIVHLQGIAEVGESGIGSVFTLPPGFRPAAGKVIILEMINEATTIIAGSNVNSGGVDLSGKVLGTPGGIVVLDSITFRAES